MINTMHGVADVRSVLETWRGADARICEYKPSLSRLLIALSRRATDGSVEYLYVLAVSCVRMTGYFHWRDSCLDVFEEVEGDRDWSSTHVLRDPAGFEVRCGSVVVVENERSDFRLDGA